MTTPGHVVVRLESQTGPCFLSVSNYQAVTGLRNILLTIMIAQGEVALSIADDAWKVAFYISFDNGECFCGRVFHPNLQY